MIDLLAALAVAAAPLGQCAIPQDKTHQGAEKLAWYVNNEEIAFKGKPFRKYGRPRVVTPVEVRLVEKYNGSWIFRDLVNLFGGPLPIDEELELVYVPVRLKSCEFQPYVLKN